MRIALVESGVVANIIEVDPDNIPLEFAGSPAPPDEASIGWIYDGTTFARPEVDAVADLALERAAMSCTPLQGKLALGEAAWSQVEALIADPETPFAMRIAITSAVQWDRTSQMMDELAWMMGLTEDQVDDLFRAAAEIAV